MVRHKKVHPISLQTTNVVRRRTSTQISSFVTHDISRRAFRTLRKLLCNSIACTAMAWFLAFFISQGNVLSGKAPRNQTYAEFLAVKILWFDAFYFSLGIVTSVHKLLPEMFVTQSAQSRLSFIRIFTKLTPPVLPLVVAVTVVSVGDCLCIVFMSSSIRKYKFELYWSFVCCAFFVAAVDTHTRHIFRNETVAGLARDRSRLGDIAPGNSTPSRRRSPSTAQYVKVLCQSLPFALSSFLASAYAHVVSSISIKTQWQAMGFAVASVGLKLFLQEIIKEYLSRQRQTPVSRSMAILIAVPTILVDTQLRTVLLSQHSVVSTMIGSALLAVVEIILRLLRMLRVMHTARRILSRSSAPIVSGVHNVAPSCVVVLTSSEQQCVVRIQKLMALHAAEVYSDMTAEYIAMGCSYAITFFFGSHPKFNFGGDDSTETSFTSYTVSLVAVALQIGIELVVDFVSSASEIRLGVDFESFNEDGPYLAVFMAVIAITNVHISSSVFLRAQ